MKKKIAVCIPTYNECKNIENTTRKIDICLKKYSRLGFETIIVNADNNSNDNTSAIFNNLKTTSKKVSLISNKIGKGNNLLNFFKFCDKENIDYALTIDADVKSLKPIWIDKYLKELIQGKKDYVTPIYQRSRYEGSTTNHFAFPIVFITTGKPIRQPIAGDFAFNLKFVRLLLKYKVNESIRQYGIDIFMTMIACYNNLNVSQVNLDKKIHNPSNGKMEKMFGEVLDAFLYIWKQLIKENPFEYRNIEKICISSDNSILSTRKFNHKKEAIVLYKKYENKLSSSITKNIEEVWISIIVKVIKNPYSITSIKKEEIKSAFIFRAVSFWLKSERYSSKYCEELILKQVKKINKQMKGI